MTFVVQPLSQSGDYKVYRRMWYRKLVLIDHVGTLHDVDRVIQQYLVEHSKIHWIKK